jgi:hypothetical protein
MTMPFRLLSGIAVLACTVTVLPAQGRCRILGAISPLPELAEASGIAISRRHPTILWSHNDGGQARLFAIGPEGSIRARIALGAKVRDWEDLAVAPCPQGSCLYAADIGDNNGTRDHIAVIRIPEPDLDGKTVPAGDTLLATYPDGARDAEAIAVTTPDDLFVITKGMEKEVVVYKFPAPLTPGKVATLRRVATLGPALVKERVTGASASPDGRWLAVRTYRSLFFYRTADVTGGTPQETLRFDLRKVGEPQGEGVALAADGTVYLSSEGGGRSGGLSQLACTL